MIVGYACTMTELDIDQALQTAANGYGQMWDYRGDTAALLVRVLLDEASDEGVYFLCEGCLRIEITTQWHPVSLQAEQFDVDGEKVWLLQDGEHCRVECMKLSAFYSDEFLKL